MYQVGGGNNDGDRVSSCAVAGATAITVASGLLVGGNSGGFDVEGEEDAGCACAAGALVPESEDCDCASLAFLFVQSLKLSFFRGGTELIAVVTEGGNRDG
jgi:hypothetical protein